MYRIRRLLIIVGTVALLAVGLAAPALASAESNFVNQINAERSARGLGSLEWYWDLADDAEAHSSRMKAEQRLYHNPNLGSVTSGWHALGENVGVGPNVTTLHQAFMDSSGHRANILGDFNYVGVGVVRESDDKMWVTVVFMKAPPGLNDPDPEPEPEPAPPPEPEPAPEPTPEPPPTPTPEPEPSPEPAPAPAPSAAPAPVKEKAAEVESATTQPLPEVVMVGPHFVRIGLLPFPD